MPEVVGEAVVQIKTDDTGLVSGAQQAGSSAGKSAGGGFRQAFKGALTGVMAAAGIQAGVTQVVDFFKGAISGASDLNETMSKTHQIFGPATDAVVRFADQGAQRLGMTKQQALDASATFGVFGKAAGLTGGDLSGFSNRLTGLATDMASFNNTTSDEAITAIGAALRGESEPIRRFGVLLDDASLRQEAMRQGLVKTTKEALTPQQRSLAAYALILRQTKDQQGDFERTSDGLANQQRILAAEFGNLQTKVGQALLPAVLAIVSAFGDLLTGTSPLSPLLSLIGSILSATVVPAFSALWDVITTVADVMGAIIGFIQDNALAFEILGAAVLIALSPIILMNAAMLIAIGVMGIYNGVLAAVRVATMLWSAAQKILNASLLANPIGLIVVAIVALVAIIILAYKHSETFRRIVDGAWRGIKAAVSAVVGWFTGPFKTFWTKTLPNFFRNAWDRAKDIFKTAIKVILAILFPFPALALVIWRRFGDRIIAAARTAWDRVKSIFRAVIGALKGIITTVVNAVVSTFNNIVDRMRQAATNAVNAVKSAFSRLGGVLSGIASTALSKAKGIGSSIMNGIRQGLSAAGGVVSDLASSIRSAVNNALGLPVHIAGPGPLPDFNIPAFARGTRNAPGGLAWVGEHGPELAWLPPGTRIWSAADSARAAQGSGATINVMLPTGDPYAAALAVANRLATL